MARQIGPAGVSPREWELRQLVRARVRELLGNASAAELARRLGDSSRTRAHKILNPNREKEVGQSITLALIEDLARALTNGSVIEFLAPILDENADALLVASTQALNRHAKALSDFYEQLVDAKLSALDRDTGRHMVELIGELGRVAPADVDVVRLLLAALITTRRQQQDPLSEAAHAVLSQIEERRRDDDGEAR